MKISRENYEIWFTEWFENKLSEMQVEELQIFLAENPDLKMEFDDLSEFSMHSPAEIFHWKGLLKRDLSEIPSDQFELLCAAGIEGDLNSDQLSELSEIIASDPGKKRTADLMARTKLNPPAIKYPSRKKLHSARILLPASPFPTILRFAFPALTAAAILTLLILTGVLRKKIVPVPGIIPITAEVHSFNAPAADPVATPDGSSAPAKSNSANVRKIVSAKNTGKHSSAIVESTSRLVVDPVQTLPIDIKPVLQFESLNSSLAEGPSHIRPPAEEDEERSRIGKLLARTFREKVLEDNKPSDKPLKGYEIAEAGITGINKLLGWDMALTRNTDDNGKISSVNFNSRLLKFNAPVKNMETGE